VSQPTQTVLIFNSLHRVMKAEEILRAAGAEARVIQVPRRLTSDCGLAVSFTEDAREAVVAALRDAGHLPDGCHVREGSAWREVDLFGSA